MLTSPSSKYLSAAKERRELKNCPTEYSLFSLRSFAAHPSSALLSCVPSNWARLLPIVWFLPPEVNITKLSEFDLGRDGSPNRPPRRSEHMVSLLVHTAVRAWRRSRRARPTFHDHSLVGSKEWLYLVIFTSEVQS